MLSRFGQYWISQRFLLGRFHPSDHLRRAVVLPSPSSKSNLERTPRAESKWHGPILESTNRMRSQDVMKWERAMRMRRYPHQPVHDGSQVASRSSTIALFFFLFSSIPSSQHHRSTSSPTVFHVPDCSRPFTISQLGREPLPPRSPDTLRSPWSHPEQSFLEAEFPMICDGSWQKRFKGFDFRCFFLLLPVLLLHPSAPNSSVCPCLQSELSSR